MISPNNPYKNVLIEKTNAKVATRLISLVQPIVEASSGTSTEPRTMQHIATFRAFSPQDEPTVLAILALLWEKHKNKLTVNLDLILGRAFAQEDFRQLEEQYLIAIYRSERPQQFVFLLKATPSTRGKNEPQL